VVQSSAEGQVVICRRRLTDDSGVVFQITEDLVIVRSDMIAAPDNTAVRVALWRALHVEVDAPPQVFTDEIGLRLADPEESWRDQPDMHPQWTSGFRASIIARARFVEDLVEQQAARGVSQYVILGAGLDTFAQRKREIASHMRIFEIDRPGPQEWKRRRLIELGFGIPDWLRFVPVDFEAGAKWFNELTSAGFDPKQPAIFASTGVSIYLTRDAIAAMLRQIAALPSGPTLAMTYLLPLELAAADERVAYEFAMKGARAAGTPFISFFTPEEMLLLAQDAGFKKGHCISAANLTQRYFADRTDRLRPASAEELLVATT
jgi:methyltransferase (TIGR00027 family)